MELNKNDKYSSLNLILNKLYLGGVIDVEADENESFQIRSWIAYHYDNGQFKTFYSKKLEILYIIKES